MANSVTVFASQLHPTNFDVVLSLSQIPINQPELCLSRKSFSRRSLLKWTTGRRHIPSQNLITYAPTTCLVLSQLGPHSRCHRTLSLCLTFGRTKANNNETFKGKFHFHFRFFRERDAKNELPFILPKDIVVVVGTFTPI